MNLIIKGALYLNENSDVVVKALSKTGEYNQIEAEVYVREELAENGEYAVNWDKFVEVDGDRYYFSQVYEAYTEDLELVSDISSLEL